MQLKTYKKIKRIINEKILGNAIVVTPELVPNQNWDWKNGDKAGDSMAVPSKNFYNYLGHYISPKEALEAPLGADVGPFENDLSIAANRTEVSSPSPLSFGSREPDETDTRVFRYVASTKIKGLYARIASAAYNGVINATASDFGGPTSLPAYSGNGDYGSNGGIQPAEVYTNNTIMEIYDVDSLLNLIETTNNDRTYNRDMHEDFAIIENYEWQGDWGDPSGEFQTAVEFSLIIIANNDRGRADAGIGFGNLNRRATNDTKSDIKIWIGDKEDVLVTYPIPTVAESGYVYNTTYEFSNAYFSTGKLKFANGENSKKTYTFRINRKPNEKFLNVYVKGNIHGNRRGELSPKGFIPVGTKIFDFVDKIMSLAFFQLLPNTIIGIPAGPSIDLRVKKWFEDVLRGIENSLNNMFSFVANLANTAFNIIAQGIFGFIFALFRESYVDTYHSTLEFELRELKVYNSIFDKLDIDKHPATRYFGPTGLKDPKSYVYTQYHYPFFDSNRFMVYGNEFYANLPYMQNEVVVGNSIKASKQYKENRYFVPNLFRILYETNIGVFYEFLLRQLNTGTTLKYNYNIKTIGTKDVPYTGHFSDNKIEEQVETVYDSMFPTDKIFFPNIANTGFSDLTCYNTSSLSGTGVSPIVDTVITPYNHQFSGISSEYDDVYSKYALGTKIGAGSTGGAVITRIQEINDIIGDFSTIKTILESSDGYSLENWTTRCNDTAQHVGLESGSASPKNLSYKIIQFILWYMQPNGIADQSRLTTRSLFEYEKLIDQDINNFDTDTYNQVEADPTKSNNPIIIGDTIYERKC